MHRLAGLVASFPSPSSGTLSIGPLKIHAYGLMIALGVVAGVWLMGRRFEDKQIGTREDCNQMAVWAVLMGVIGSRLYHVATDWQKFEHHLSDIPKIWQGGLGIPGGLLFGIPTGLWVLKRRGVPVGLAANCGGPGIALAQAIGRWGNYWNQELFGKATTLPWAVRIDAAHATDSAGNLLGHAATYHPTFLYESLGNFALAGVLLLIDKRFKVRPGNLMAMYIGGYGVIRFFVEGLRIDEAHHVGGLRWNQWIALAAVLGAGIFLFVRRNADLATAGATAGEGTLDRSTTEDNDMSDDMSDGPDRDLSDGDADGDFTDDPDGDADGDRDDDAADRDTPDGNMIGGTSDSDSTDRDQGGDGATANDQVPSV